MEQTQPVKIKADIMWAYMDKPNEMSGKYQIDLCQLSDAAVSALEGMGLTVRQKEDKGYFITCKSTNPIKAFNPTGEPLEGITIGNGSKAVAMVGFYEWKYQKKEGLSPSLKRLVIEDLVQYESDSSFIDVDDGETL